LVLPSPKIKGAGWGGGAQQQQQRKSAATAAAAAVRARGNEINIAMMPNALLTCRLVVFGIVNQKLPKVWPKNWREYKIKQNGANCNNAIRYFLSSMKPQPLTGLGGSTIAVQGILDPSKTNFG
jgi:hypothetical protein